MEVRELASLDLKAHGSCSCCGVWSVPEILSYDLGIVLHNFDWISSVAIILSALVV